MATNDEHPGNGKSVGASLNPELSAKDEMKT